MTTGLRAKFTVVFLSICLHGLWSASSSRGADVSYYGVIKSIQYLQTNDAAPAVLTNNGYAFRSFVVAATTNAVTNATVKVGTTGTPTPLIADTNGLSWQFLTQFNTQSALDTAYPVGSFGNVVNYTVAMSTVHDGLRSGAINFFLFNIVAVSYPSTPQLTGLAAAQSVDSTRDYTLAWNSLGGSSIAIVELLVLDAGSNVVYSSPAPFQPGALDGTATGYTIPAYSLPPGVSLQGHLLIGNPASPNTNSYVGAVGIAALVKDTQFPLTTRPAPSAPRLTLHNQGGLAQVQLNGESNRLYQILRSPNLITWTNLFTTNSASGTFTYTDPQSATNSIRFYRGKVGQ
jgi:hypothetical protein